MVRRSKSSPSQRQLRVGELIRQRLSVVLHRNNFGNLGDGADLAAAITVTEVRMTPDLRHARAYIMPLGGAQLDETVAALNAMVGRIKKQVMAGLRLKYTPQLVFVADMSFEQGAAMDHLLDNLPPTEQPKARGFIKNGTS